MKVGGYFLKRFVASVQHIIGEVVYIFLGTHHPPAVTTCGHVCRP